MRSSRSREGPWTYMTGVLIRRQPREGRTTGIKPWDDRQRMELQSCKREMQRLSANHQKPESSTEKSLDRLQREHGSGNTFTSGFQPPVLGDSMFLCLRFPAPGAGYGSLGKWVQSFTHETLANTTKEEELPSLWPTGSRHIYLKLRCRTNQHQHYTLKDSKI